MGLEPKIEPKDTFLKTKTCEYCGTTKKTSHFRNSNSILSKDGLAAVCDECIERKLRETTYNWESVDKICQYLDIPFIPDEFEKVHKINQDNPFTIYAQLMQSEEYRGIDWGTYWKKFNDLLLSGELEKNLPLLRDAKRKELQQKWGFNYDDEALEYLENLYHGLTLTQNVNGALSTDQAFKLCKISYTIDQRIEEGTEIDKLLSSYDKLVKIADFTPKNAKNANDFDSIGELIKWLEKKGWKNKFYDDVTRDIVDETIKNIQANNQRLYINETGIGDDITARLNSLKMAKELENNYDLDVEHDLSEYENDGYEELMKDEEFEVMANE